MSIVQTSGSFGTSTVSGGTAVDIGVPEVNNLNGDPAAPSRGARRTSKARIRVTGSGAYLKRGAVGDTIDAAGAEFLVPADGEIEVPLGPNHTRIIGLSDSTVASGYDIEVFGAR